MQGCQREVIKNIELHFVVSLCVPRTRSMPQKGQDRSPKGGEGEEYVVVYIVSEIIIIKLLLNYYIKLLLNYYYYY